MWVAGGTVIAISVQHERFKSKIPPSSLAFISLREQGLLAISTPDLPSMHYHCHVSGRSTSHMRDELACAIS